MAELKWDRAFALEQAADDEELLAELVELFHESSLTDFLRIKKCMAEKDPQGVGDAAHSIKGAAASLGVEGVRQVTDFIEKAGRAGDLDGAETKIEELEMLLDEFKKTI